jgi:hypothetical protein
LWAVQCQCWAGLALDRMSPGHHILGHQEGEELVPGGPGPGDARSCVAFRERGEGPPQHLCVELAQEEPARGGPELGCQVGRHPGRSAR